MLFTCLLIGSEGLFKLDAQHLVLLPNLSQCVLQLKHFCANLPLQRHLIILHQVRKEMRKTQTDSKTGVGGGWGFTSMCSSCRSLAVLVVLRRARVSSN